MDYQIQIQLDSKKMTIDLMEDKSSSNACDLTVQKIEYFADLKLLDIRLVPVLNCPLDLVGNRKAHIEWSTPFNFSSQKEVSIRVNGKVRTKVNLEKLQVPSPN